ncbi:MAG: PxKF domain-containing protein [Chloroflexota bacterium]
MRYLNRGVWIFNWKTDKSYAGTCRNLFILFSDGSMSPEVTFQFR